MKNPRKRQDITIKSSAAEYLTFVASTGESENSFEMRYEDGELLKDSVVKIYLITASDMQRIVSLYLDYAELQAERKIPMSMEDWAMRLDGFLEFNGNEILTGPGKISTEEAKLHAETEFEKYRIIQDRLFKSDFDRFLEVYEEE